MDMDIYGNLKLLLEGEWVTIPQAMAYQVANDGSIIPVNWTAGYDAYENVGRAYFNFSNYDHGKPLFFLVGPLYLGREHNLRRGGPVLGTCLQRRGFRYAHRHQTGQRG
ncbi:MAG: hypothetical protein IPO60_18235 [Flavobacteriales bacterium]|nr:hypothetical protein [Flavobacteriales bacterium]